MSFRQRNVRRLTIGAARSAVRGRKKKSEPLAEEVFPAFAALFQGDHLGVEFALGGHEGL